MRLLGCSVPTRGPHDYAAACPQPPAFPAAALDISHKFQPQIKRTLPFTFTRNLHSSIFRCKVAIEVKENSHYC